MLKKIIEWLLNPGKASKKEAERTLKMQERYKQWAGDNKHICSENPDKKEKS